MSVKIKACVHFTYRAGNQNSDFYPLFSTFSDLRKEYAPPCKNFTFSLSLQLTYMYLRGTTGQKCWDSIVIISVAEERFETALTNSLIGLLFRTLSN